MACAIVTIAEPAKARSFDLADCFEARAAQRRHALALVLILRARACAAMPQRPNESQREEASMSYSIDLSGRVALVTGASSGLGAQFAQTLARAGAAVVLAGRRIERLKTLRAEIEADGGDAHVVELDVTDHDSIKAAVAHAETEMGAIDILVNNSGVSTTQKLVDVTEDDYDFIFDTNTKGAFFVAQEVGKRMLARARGAAPGTFTGGRIVNIASMAGLKVLGQIGVYCMSKAAVIHMTRAMALEWGRFGINVNAICPGYIDTEINHHHWQTERARS